MALSFQDSLALTQMTSGETATPGYGAATIEEIATYNNLANPENIIEYNKNYLVFDVFSDSNVSVVDISKDVKVQTSQLNITQEKNSQYIPFSLMRKADGYDLYNGVIWIVTDAGTKDNEKGTYAVSPINVYATEDKVYFGWLIDDWITRKSGQINFEIHVHGQVQGKDGSNVVTRGYIWKSKPGTLNVTASKLNLDEIVEENYNEAWVQDIISAAAENIAFSVVEEQVNEAIAAKDAAVLAKSEATTAANNATALVNSFNATVEAEKANIITLAASEVESNIADKVKEITWDQEIPIILGYEYEVTEVDGYITDINITVADYVAQELENYYTKSDIDTAFSALETEIEDTYATKTDVKTAIGDLGVDSEGNEFTTVAAAIKGVDVTSQLNALSEDIANTYATKASLGDLGTKEDGTAFTVAEAIANVDITDSLGELGQNEDGSDKTVKQYVDEAIENVDVTTELNALKAEIDAKIGDLGTDADGTETTVKEYVDAAVKNADISGKLTDYVKQTEFDIVASDVNKNTEKVAVLQESVDNLPTVHTYNINYDTATNLLSLYEYTDEDNQAEDPEYGAKAQFTITGGSGGGGGGATSLTVTRITSSPYVIPAGDKAAIEYRVEAFEMEGTELGAGLSQVNAVWKLNNKTIKSETLVLSDGIYDGSGDNAFDISSYITSTKQRFVLTITAEDGTLRTRDWYAYEVDLSIESSFDDTKAYSGDVPVRYIPYGNISKDVHFVLDGEEIDVITTTVSGSSQSYTIPAQEHGAHLLEIYAVAAVEGQNLESNHVFKDIMWYDAEVGTTVIGSQNQTFTARQYESTALEYVVYVDETTETADVVLQASHIDAETGEEVIEFTTSATVDTKKKQTWTYKSDVIGEHTLTITCNGQIKTLVGTITELDIDVNPVTLGLVFDFDPTGYTNDSADRIWSYTNSNNETYSMVLSDNFDWINGGYQLDENNDQYFLIKAGTTATIDYELFGDDAKQTGKEFKLVFKTQNVANGETVILDCLSEVEITDEETGETSIEQVGLQMKAHEATIYAKSENLPLPYSEEEIIEFEFNITQKDEDIPMVMGYEDGVSTRPMVYGSTHDFQQRAGYKKQIILGSEQCDLLVYRFKVYNVSLSDKEILDNFIADARNADEMISRFDRNQIYDPNNNYQLTPEYLAEMCPDLRIIKIECPRFTTDKSDYVGETKIEMIYANGDPILDNWYTEDCVHSGQGTSSNAYGPAGRNLDLILKRFKKKDVYYNTNPKIYYKDGTETKLISLTRESVPVDYFNVKVNIASSENANNALLQKRYNLYNPYDRPFVRYGDTLEDHFTEEEIAAMSEEEKTVLLAQYQAEADAIIPYIKDTMEFHNCVIFVKETGKYADGREAKRSEFEDDAWHFYAIGNIGDSKKTDDTRLTDPKDPYECIIEVMDNTLPLSTFPTGYINEETGGPLYPITEEQWETMDNSAYSALYYEKFNEAEAKDKANGLADTYGMRYLWEDGETDEENDAAFDYIKNKWREFYKFIVTASDEEFHSQLGDWVVLDSILYYYLFTLRYTMTDNHAKNCFWHYGKSNDKDTDGNAIRKWDLCFDYDNDTALGIDNLGRMSYRYGYEEIDKVDDTSEWVWNAPNHTFFMRIRENFAEELSNLFVSLESKEAWSSTGLINQWNESQAQFPEELWRLDIDRKYLRTYKTSGPAFEYKAYPDFLRLRANGRKKTQRSQFEKNQEKYMASKFGGNVSRNDKLYFRCQADAASDESKAAVPPNYNFKLIPFSYTYLTVKYGTSDVGGIRAVPGQVYEIPFNGGANDDVDIIEVYSASSLQDLGDLSTFYLKEGTFGAAKKISRLKLGNSNPAYNNPNNVSVGLGQNDLLKELDLTNIKGFSWELDLSGLPNLEELYTFGTSSAGITFAEGGAINWVDLPNVSTLIMKDLASLTDATYDENENRTGGLLSEGFSKLTTLVAENSKLDLVSIIKAATNLYRARIVGVDWNLSNEDMEILERLYEMTGLSSSNDNIEQSVLTGKVHVPVIKEYELYKYQETWPELTITYDSIHYQHPVYFVNEDGTILETQYVIMGEFAVDPLEREEDPMETPTKESTISTYYTFAGWDTDFSDLPILEPTTITATYTSALRTYSIQYVSKGIVLDTYTGLYGENKLYTGEIPTYTAQESAYNFQLFSRWDKSGFLTEGPDGTDLVDGVKTVNAIFDEFQFTTSAFRGKELSDLTPVEVYALTKMGLDNVDIGQLDEETGVYEGLQKGDPYSFMMGYDIDYDDVESAELISEPRTFTGTKNDYLDTGIQLLDDRDFVIAIDFNMATDSSAASVLAQCYNSYNSVGFQLGYSSGVNLKWGPETAPTKIAVPGKREIIVLRHIKGDSNLYVYSSNLDSKEPLLQTIVTTKTGLYDSSLIFGCKKEDDGSYGNYGKGTIFWSKIWYADLGEEVCEKLVGWTHEEIKLAIDGMKRYYISGSSKKTTFSLMGTQLLDRTRVASSSGSNMGGYPVFDFFEILNTRFYKAMPVQIQSLTKQVNAGYTIGGNTNTVERGDFYVLIPSMYDVGGSANTTQTAHFIEEAGGDEGNRTDITNAEQRRRLSADGTISNYWLRSTLYYPTQTGSYYNQLIYGVSADGAFEDWTNVTSARGILIEISF